MKTRPESLDSIPGIGKALSRKLNAIGISRVSDLRSKDPEQLFKTLERALGTHVDRCVLYTFRCAVYFANHERHDPAKLKWWNWKDNPETLTKGIREPNKALHPTRHTSIPALFRRGT
jgi:hypothetical protein